jgi:hypothetical protein
MLTDYVLIELDRILVNLDEFIAISSFSFKSIYFPI